MLAYIGVYILYICIPIRDLLSQLRNTLNGKSFNSIQGENNKQWSIRSSGYIIIRCYSQLKNFGEERRVANGRIAVIPVVVLFRILEKKIKKEFARVQ